jgi:hypothetical protein
MMRCLFQLIHRHYWCCVAQVIYNIHDRQPVPIHDPCQLPVGNFTFIATADNQLTFGEPVCSSSTTYRLLVHDLTHVLL